MLKTSRLRKQTSEAAVSLSSVTPDTDSKNYERRIRELECENEAFQNEIKDLKCRLEIGLATAATSSQKLREGYLQKLEFLEDQVTQLKKKQDTQSQLSCRRQKGDGEAKQSDLEIMSLKAQKVQLQCKMKLESVQFRLCKASLEKEVLQLKKENRRNEYEMNKLLTSNQRLKMVLQRKTEEASEVTKRLRSMMESRKTSAQRRADAGTKHGNFTETQDVENEIGIIARLNDLCSEYEHQIEEMDKQIIQLKEEADILKQEKTGCLSQECLPQETDLNISENTQDINALKEQMAILNGLFKQMRIQKFNHIHKDTPKGDSGPASISAGSNHLFERSDTPGVGDQQRFDVAAKKTGKSDCCFCSKRSLCKTNKCKCRSTGSSCGASCGCALGKCSNREAVDTEENEFVDALLFQSAEDEKPEGADEFAQKLKPLSDIRNVLTNQKQIN